MLSGTRANVAVKIFGDDLRILHDLAGQGTRPDVSGRRRRRSRGRAQAEIPTVRVRVDSAAASVRPRHRDRRGFAPDRTGWAHGPDRCSRARSRFRSSSATRSTCMPASRTSARREFRPDRTSVPLSPGRQHSARSWSNFVMRENAQRRLVVQCNVTGRDLRVSSATFSAVSART